MIEHCWPNEAMIQKMQHGTCPVWKCQTKLRPAEASRRTIAAGTCPRHGNFSLRLAFRQPGCYVLFHFDRDEVRVLQT